MVSNYAIWSRLLNKTWLKNKVLQSSDSNVRNIQADGLRILKDTEPALQKSTIALADMHVIVNNRQTYESLAKQQDMNAILEKDVISPCTEVLKTFDVDLEHLRNYVNFFCSIGKIES